MVVKRQQETFAPVTLGHIRSHGCRDHHSATLNGDWLSDEYIAKAWPALMIP